MCLAVISGSPKRAARRAAGRLVPPIINGGCGSVNGRGVTCTVVPWYSNGSAVHAFNIVSTTSSWSAPRCVPVLLEHRVFLGPVPDAGDDREASRAGEVEHRDVLGDAQRVVQWREQRRDRHRDALRATEDQAGQHQGRRAVAVVDAVVLLEREHGEPVLVGVPGHLDDGLVARRELGAVHPGLDAVEA